MSDVIIHIDWGLEAVKNLLSFGEFKRQTVVAHYEQ